MGSKLKRVSPGQKEIFIDENDTMVFMVNPFHPKQKEYAEWLEKTQHQAELIERLVEIVKKYIDDRKGVAGLTPVGTDMYNDLHQEIREAESLIEETNK